MTDESLVIPCVLMRGGTSRGLVFRREHLPADRGLWDLVFLAALGSPDPRQLDGVGAGDSHTSKIAVVEPSSSTDADLNYLFGEVAITEPRVDYAGNSGNLISALGLFAVEEGWVEARGESARVRVRNLNTDKITEVSVPLENGAARSRGDFSIDGVPGQGARIDLVFPDPAGALTGRLLPTAEPITRLQVPGLGEVAASLVDAANPLVIVEGKRLGVAPEDPVTTLNADAEFLRRTQALRAEGAVRMGLVPRAQDAWAYSNMVPFPVLLFPPSDYPKFGVPGEFVSRTQMDLCARVVSLNMVHKSINVTVSVGLTATAMIPGTLAHALSEGRASRDALRIGHPSGVIETRGRLKGERRSELQVEWVSLGRTARRIMQGEIVVSTAKLEYLRSQLDVVAHTSPS